MEEEGHGFLTEDGVLTNELVRAWTCCKRDNEIKLLRVRPHPRELSLHYAN